VYVDANVFVQALASPDPVEASVSLLVLSNTAGCFELLCAETAREEAVRHVRRMVPDATEYLHDLLEYEVNVFPDPSEELVRDYEGEADPKDVIHLASAIEQDCDYGVYSGLVETRYREGVLPRCMKSANLSPTKNPCYDCST